MLKVPGPKAEITVGQALRSLGIGLRVLRGRYYHLLKAHGPVSRNRIKKGKALETTNTQPYFCLYHSFIMLLCVFALLE